MKYSELASCSYNILMATKKSHVEECSRRYNVYIGKGNEARQALGEFISIKEELKFRDNLTCFAWFLDIISSSVMNDDIKKKIIMEANLEKSFMKKTSENITVSVPTNSKGRQLYGFIPLIIDHHYFSCFWVANYYYS